MAASPDLVRTLEDDGNRAWPAAEVEVGPGWELRWSDGLHRRINSATIHTEADPRAAIAAVTAFYAARTAPPIVKITAAASHPAIDRLLADVGWAREIDTQVRTAPTAAAAPDPDTGLDTPRDRWLAAYADAAGHEPDPRFAAIVDRIADPWFAAIEVDGEPGAVGLGVPVGGRMGIFAMVTRPRHRGKGLASAIVRTLMARAADRGIPEAFLQVFDTNRSAIHLYARLGFVEQYRYWYRQGPA